MIGKTIATQVTSVLQTTAGKMIFGRFPEETEMGTGSQGPRQDNRRPSYDKAPMASRAGAEEDKTKSR
jgi:hypothetical protein